MQLEYDVIVIGGGAAGLAAAGELGRRGLKVAVLEARHRLGGRILTERAGKWPRPSELGAEFIHDGNKELWRLLRRHRLQTRRVPARHWLLRNDELVRLRDISEPICRVTSRIDAARMRGWSFADYLRWKGLTVADEDRQIAATFAEGFNAAPADELSAIAMEGETLDVSRQFAPRDGMDSIIAALADEIPSDRVATHLRSPVSIVKWQRGVVCVEAGRKAFRASALVVTLPLGVLQMKPPQRGAVSFEPRLREKESVWSRMRMGHVIRLNLRFDRRRWNSLLPHVLHVDAPRGFGFIHTRLKGVPVWWSLQGDGVLTGWSGGSAAIALARQPDSSMLATALGSLSSALTVPVRRLRGALLDWNTHNWTRDPFSRGAYSFNRAGHENSVERLRVPIADTIFFAGEATADADEIGTIHGAVASGLRAAQEVRL